MRFIFLFVVICPLILFGQNQLFTEKDTITFSNRAGGKIDSLDMSYTNQLATFSGGGLNCTNNVFTPQFFFQTTGLQNFRTIKPLKPMQFSGVPHIGFTYSFGSKGSQFLHFDYQQAFSKKVLLNVDGLRNSSNGFLRNSKFNDNVVNVQLRRCDKFYSLLLEGSYASKAISLNGGITNDTFLTIQGLDFMPVAKNDAKNSIKMANVKLSHYFNLLKDSVNGFGLVIKNQYEATNRVYSETADSVPNWNIDSMKTRDQYRLASIRNSAGIYYKQKRIYIDFLLQHRYWDYQNITKHRDTNEINATSSLRFDTKQFSLKNELTLNIIGAGGEWSNKSYLSTSFGKIDFSGTFQIEQKWPDAFQRFYFSNYYNYQLISYQLQTRVHTAATASYSFSSKHSIQLNYANTLLKNNYFFINNTWRNDTLDNVMLNSLSASGSFSFGIFTIQPKATLTVSTANFNYIPATTFNSRIFLKKRMFKAKKMEGIIGTDISWISSYNLLSYNTPMDAFIFNSTPQKFNSMTNLSAFVGFAIDEFRFYARVENIGYIWNDRTNQVVVGYPIQKNFIRLGITWDFFN